NNIVYTVTTEDNATKGYAVVFESPQKTGLPLMKIDTQGGVAIASKETYVYTNIKIVDPNNAAYNVELTGYKDRIRGRGNATWSYPKKPYKIKLDKKTDMLGMGKDKDWVLLANYCDKTLLRTAIAFKLGELLEFPWTPKARFVELFLNGEYMGNYQLVEGIKQGDDRVDIPETGYIVERDGYYLSEPRYFVTNDSYGYSFKNPDTDDLTDDQWNYIRDYMNEFESALGSGSFADPVNGYSKYIDTESFAKWFLFQNILANMDTNPFLVKADDTYTTQLFMGPVWDFEWSIGIGWYDGSRPRPADYWVQNGWYFAKLLTDDVFVGKLQNLWNQNKTLVRQEILQFIDDTKDEIMKSQVMNFRRWDILNDRISVGGIPLGSFEAEVTCDSQFFINHMDWLDTAINEL
ncbi:MAG: CotH kinase family protein, partial [Treponema sp.]|nr:CotH kinase family protein [Treponema sp.]